jgi:hypothetical protein
MRTQEPEMRQASRDEDQHRSARLSLRRCAAYSSRARSHAASRRNTATYRRNPDRLIHSQAAVVDVGRAPHSWSHQLGSPIVPAMARIPSLAAPSTRYTRSSCATSSTVILRLPVGSCHSADLSQSTGSAASRKFNPAFSRQTRNCAPNLVLWRQALRGTRTSTVSLMQRTCLATTSDYSEVNTTHRRDYVAVAASGRQKACPGGTRADRGRSPRRPLREQCDRPAPRHSGARRALV